VWNIPRPAESELYPTMKPLALVERAIVNSSRPGDIVLDLFRGSGTQLIACERLGRRCYALELAYVDVAVRRWEAFSGEKAEKE
jgi:DNA modification methylase